MLGLCCCTWAFSSWGAGRGVATLFGGTEAAVVVWHVGFSCSAAGGLFQDCGLIPCPPALVCGFLSSVPPGKSPRVFFFLKKEKDLCIKGSVRLAVGFLAEGMG